MNNSNTIQPLYVDLNNNANLNNNFTNFINNLMQYLNSFISYYNSNNNSILGAGNSFGTIMTNIIQGQLENGTYAYDSNTLITLGNNNCQQLAFDIASDFGLYFLNFSNAYYLALGGANQTLNVLIGNTFGNVSASGQSSYQAQSVQNGNQYNTIANVNAQMGSASGGGTSANGTAPTVNDLGGFTPIGNPQNTSSTSALQITLNNGAMNNDTTPIANSSASVGGSSTNQMDSTQIANFLQQNFKPFTQKLRDVLYDTFYEYLLPVNNLDNDVGGYNG